LLNIINPVSWQSTDVQGGYLTPNLADRTAFIFNLTTSVYQAQRTDDAGQYQTDNFQAYGPSFGQGYSDIYAPGNMEGGIAYSYSYGDGNGGESLLGVSGTNGPAHSSEYNGIEVFTVTASVPEPGPIALGVGAGTLGLMAVRHRGKRKDGRGK
jgi:hypothetical protein